MLSSFLKSLSHTKRDETGATAVEYGIMVALIAVVIIAAVTLLGGTVQDTFTKISCNMTAGKVYTPGASAGQGACN